MVCIVWYVRDTDGTLHWIFFNKYIGFVQEPGNREDSIKYICSAKTVFLRCRTMPTNWPVGFGLVYNKHNLLVVAGPTQFVQINIQPSQHTHTRIQRENEHKCGIQIERRSDGGLAGETREEI